MLSFDSVPYEDIKSLGHTDHDSCLNYVLDNFDIIKLPLSIKDYFIACSLSNSIKDSYTITDIIHNKIKILDCDINRTIRILNYLSKLDSDNGYFDILPTELWIKIISENINVFQRLSKKFNKTYNDNLITILKLYLCRMRKWDLSLVNSNEEILNLVEIIRVDQNNCVTKDNKFTYILYNGSCKVVYEQIRNIKAPPDIIRIYGNQERQGTIAITSKGKLYYNGTYIVNLLKQSNNAYAFGRIESRYLCYQVVPFEKFIVDIVYITNVIFLLDNEGDVYYFGFIDDKDKPHMFGEFKGNGGKNIINCVSQLKNIVKMTSYHKTVLFLSNEGKVYIYGDHNDMIGSCAKNFIYDFIEIATDVIDFVVTSNYILLLKNGGTVDILSKCFGRKNIPGINNVNKLFANSLNSILLTNDGNVITIDDNLNIINLGLEKIFSCACYNGVSLLLSSDNKLYSTNAGKLDIKGDIKLLGSNIILVDGRTYELNITKNTLIRL
jgi:hypothetical protein